MDKSSIIFCVGSILVCLGITIFALPLASMSEEKLKNADIPMDAEKIKDISLGEFGRVSILEMLDYYLENPPKNTALETAKKEIHFQGC